MLFFQVVLLAGYAYAHLVSTRLKPKWQAVTHLGLTAAAFFCLPAIPSDAWKPDGAGDPTWRIIGLLAATIGLPYLVLSATSPLLQHWFARTESEKSPYRLYALSNVGSLLALASYPTVVRDPVHEAGPGENLGLGARGVWDWDRPLRLESVGQSLSRGRTKSEFVLRAPVHEPRLSWRRKGESRPEKLMRTTSTHGSAHRRPGRRFERTRR